MKNVLLLTAFILFSVFVKAQSNVRYQGEVDLGYSVGIGNFSTDRINLHTVQGVKIGEYFSAGVGTGLDYYYDLYDEGSGELVLPVYLNLKGYIPVNGSVSPFFSFDIGAGFGLTEGVKGLSGMLVTPSVGVKINKFKVQLGYNMQEVSESGISVKFKALQIKVGFVF